MPMVFFEPGWSAACGPQYILCSSPGDSDSPQVSMMTSKSKTAQSVLILRVVYDTDGGADANPFERCL
jgi:hypothetical protein